MKGSAFVFLSLLARRAVSALADKGNRVVIDHFCDEDVELFSIDRERAEFDAMIWTSLYSINNALPEERL